MQAIKTVLVISFLLLLLLGLQVFSADKVQLGISNVEDITDKLKDLLAVELIKPIQVPATPISACAKIDLQCTMGESEIHLIQSAQDFKFKVEATPGQTFVYTLELPKAIGTAVFVVRGKVMGRVFDMKFKIEANSITTLKEDLDDPDIDWLKGSGKLFLEVKDNLFVASSISFPRWKIDRVKITPVDRLAQIFMTTFGRFADLEQLVLSLLNSQIQNYLQDANLHSVFAKALNGFFTEIPKLLATLKSFGVNATLAPISFSTAQRKINIDLIAKLGPTQEQHSCASGLYPNTSGLYKSWLLKNASDNTVEPNSINIAWPVSFFEHALYLLAKYPFLDRQGKLTPPILCQNGVSEISILRKKQKFNYSFAPVKSIHLTSEDGDSSGHLFLNMWVELQGQSDQYPKLSFKRRENKKKVPGILINIEARLWLALTDKGLVFEMKELKFKEVIGKAKLSWRIPPLSISIPMDKMKQDLEKAVVGYIESNLSRMILLSPTIEISEGHSLTLSKVKLNSKEITSTLMLE